MAGTLSTELKELMESKVIELSSYVTGVLHTARISTVEFIVSSNKWMMIVNFERNDEMWKMNFLSHAWERNTERECQLLIELLGY